MKKVLTLAAVLAAFCSFTSFAADTNASANPSAINAAALNGPSGMGMVYIFENPPVIAGVTVNMQTAASPDILLPKLLKGEIDIGILPPNAAAKVYNKNNKAVVVGAVVGNGMLSLMSKDTHVKTITDLKGKKITVAGQGSTPEYMLRYLLKKNGIEDSDAELDFSIPTAEIAPALITGKIEYAFVPEPFATIAAMKNSSIVRSIDAQSAFAAVTGGTGVYPMTVVVIRREFAEKYPDAVIQFLDAYNNSIAKTNADPSAAGALVEKHSLGLTAAVAAKSIPNAAFVFTPAAQARSSIESLLSLFLEYSPASVGGALPGDSFYFSK